MRMQQLADYAREAAASGQTVTVTARRRMLTSEQVAKALGLSRSTISRQIKAGQIPAIKLGIRNRVPYEAFERHWDQVMTHMIAAVGDDIEADLFCDE